METVRHELRHAAALVGEAALTTVDATLKTAGAAPASNPYRAAHRMGRPSKIAADPELEVFIRARMDTVTFPELATEIAARFPPERRVSKSGLHRWWTRYVAPVRRTP